MNRRRVVSGDAGRVWRDPFGMDPGRNEERVYLAAAGRLDTILGRIERETGPITGDDEVWTMCPGFCRPSLDR